MKKIAINGMGRIGRAALNIGHTKFGISKRYRFCRKHCIPDKI
jgi:lactate dehydrogenase-like 2-hydroxyacid dehydrogenase